MLRELEETVEIVPTSAEVWELSRSLARLTREKGLTIPVTDLLVAACAKHHGLEILHRDAHFDNLAQVMAGER